MDVHAGAEGTATGEVCFNTSLEGYFEVMTTRVMPAKL